MTPLDHLRSWYASLGEAIQYEIAFALIPALSDDFQGRRFQSELDFVRAFCEWLSPPKRVPRGLGKVLSVVAVIDHTFGVARPGTADNAVWERIEGSWQGLKRRHLGTDALDAWAEEVLAATLEALGFVSPSGRAPIRH